jgi:hypothetical protein
MMNMRQLQQEESNKSMRRKGNEREECLVRSRKKKRQQQTIDTMPCSNDAVWSWRVNGKGHLVYEKTNTKQPQPQRSLDRQCLWRTNNDTSVELSPCDEEHDDSHDKVRRIVSFSLVRFQAAANATQLQDLLFQSISMSSTLEEAGKARTVGVSRVKSIVKRWKKKMKKTKKETSKPAESVVEKRHIQTTRDLAHSHASIPPSERLEKEKSHKPQSQMLKPTGVSISSRTSRKTTPKKKTPFLSLKDTNPILFIGGEHTDENVLPATPIQTQSVTGGPTATISLHPPANKHDPSYKKARIQLHPYLQAAKNGVWTDPATGLEYRTDLHEYLGHTRKEAGRHTLVGVGLYTRTVFNVKVRLGFLGCDD